ncbi:MAG: XRE family transcriptional regulator [Candidatus Zixiibacteriota bacterium]
MIGERIKSARKANGLALRDLAKIVNVSQTAIDKYEKGKIFPSSDKLMAIIDALNYPLDYFFRENSIKLGEISYRKRSGLGKKKQHEIESRAIDFLERYLYAEGLIPSINSLFKIPNCFSKKIEGYDDIEDLCLELRKEWQLGFDPIGNLIEVLEDLGVKIVLLDIDEKGFDGFCVWANENIPVIAISKNWPGDRQRFTIAHELGHLLIKKYNNNLDSENIANRFAGAFLFPRPSVLSEIGSSRTSIYIDELKVLKIKYGLSMQSIIFRAKDLNLISKSLFERAWKVFNKKGWRKVEPEKLPSESPKRFELLIFRAVIENIIGEAKAAELLNTSISSIRSHIQPLLGASS